MKVSSTIAFILLISFTYGQDFKLNYWTTGLGSDASWLMADEHRDCNSGLKIEIIDSILTYSICEQTDDYEIDPTFKDTLWVMQRNFYQVQFRQSSIDSIVSCLDTLKGKYVYRTNPKIMSGSIFNYYIEFNGECSRFVLKNTFDSAALLITQMINSYLSEAYQIYTPDSRWMSNEYDEPLVKDCPISNNGTYREILEQEYDLIKKTEFRKTK